MSKVDGKVTMRLGCIQIVYVHKFLMSLLVRLYAYNLHINIHFHANIIKTHMWSNSVHTKLNVLCGSISGFSDTSVRETFALSFVCSGLQPVKLFDYLNVCHPESNGQDVFSDFQAIESMGWRIFLMCTTGYENCISSDLKKRWYFSIFTGCSGEPGGLTFQNISIVIITIKILLL